MEKQTKYSISTLVDVGNDAFRDGEKAGRQAERDRIGKSLDKISELVWDIYGDWTDPRRKCQLISDELDIIRQTLVVTDTKRELGE